MVLAGDNELAGVILFSVSVPVLSEQIADTDPASRPTAAA